ncbi:heavy metal-associated isoprenylated plant protein 32-like [Prosopis cineraria]|uniref:heavy metal-associated isoprenylated plant protein 32-like n=1 Tax=Prosopis cineraria TaxID=364024 RepID=UPI00240F272A|nr:heavy metal-associated isoprenylated plant protein 32-like [Prosopis cineraria]
MFSSERVSSTNMTCGLKVDTRCKGWDRTMGKLLKKIKGVSYDLDAEEGMIYISGKVDPQKILSKITKHGKHAELCWMKTGDQNHVFMDERAHVPYGGGIMPIPSLPQGGHFPVMDGSHVP